MKLPGLRRTKVFVSYSHKDKSWTEHLLAHLAGLGDGAVWIDTDAIDAGEKWDEEIGRGLETACVAVLLISAPFLASRYIREKELPRLLAAAEGKHLTLLPIYLLPCEVPETLAAYQAVNSPAKTLADLKDDPAEQARVWMKVGQEIRKALFELITVTVAKEDRDDLEQVLALLEPTGLRFDVEEYEIADERELQKRVVIKLGQRQAALLCFGRRGLGLWEAPVMKEAIDAARKAGRRLISAVLPAVPADLALPPGLPDSTCIRFPRGLDDATTIDRLWMGLTGKWKASSLPPPPPPPTPPPPPPPEEPALATEPLVSDLAERLAFENLTLFLGTDLAALDPQDIEGDEKPPPRLHELTRALLQDLDLTTPADDRLLLPLDVASTYFAVRRGERSLESKLCDMIRERRRLTSIHCSAAQLLRTLADLETAGRFARRGARPARLVVTTNVDLLMERSLLLAGVPFVRLVQDRSGEKILINVYESVILQGSGLIVQTGEDQRKVRRDDVDGLCEIITSLGSETLTLRSAGKTVAEGSQNPLRTLPLEQYKPQVFLYKFHGSEDVGNSCAISIDQHLRLIKAVLAKNVVPLKITELLSSGPVLVFGYGLLDPPFRVLLHTLPIEMVSELGDGARRYLLQLPPQEDDPDGFRRLEQRLWPKIKEQAGRYGLELLERRGDHFLDALSRALTGRWGEQGATDG